MRLRAGLAALIGALVAVALVARALNGGGPDAPCPAGGCSTVPTQLACHELGTRDLNPENRPISPKPDRPLLPRRSDGRVQMGFNDSAYQAGQATLAEDVALQRGAGSTLWRLPLSWSAAEPSPGEFDFAQTDPGYCAALEAGIQPVLVLSDSPGWAADTSRPCPDSCVRPPTPEHDADLQRFAEAAAIRYPDAAAIEAWNEPNLHQYWASPDPADYVDVLRAIYQGVKDGDPSMPVLGGGFSNQQADDPVTGNLSETTFLNGMYVAGAAQYMDALSVHPYPVYPLDDPRELFSPTMATVRSIAARYEGPEGPRLWVTELGAVTPPVGPTGFPFSPAQQAGTLLGIYQRLNRAPDVDAVIFHTLIEPTAAIPGPPGFGWVLPRDPADNFYPKPAYCAFANLLARPIDCGQPIPLTGAG